MSVKIAVISDSHIGQKISAYPAEILNAIGECDIIIHAGDHTSMESVELLNSLGNLRAVHGNMDEITISNLLPSRLVFEVEGIRIGVTHGWGSPLGIERRVLDVFVDEKLDIVIFGHSHSPCDKIIDGIRVINPGAISGNLQDKSSSWGILTINGCDADWRLIEFSFK
ncbi:metallophosphoesterase [bacterium]|nr:metallophosphoesterase [bacterium]